MKISKSYILALCGGTLMLTACSENAWNDHLDGFEVPPVYGAVETVEYTLTSADYASIASNSTNKELAEEAGLTDALAAVATNNAFATDSEARMFIPALIGSSSFPYFTLNNGSSLRIGYNLATNQPAEVLAINKACKSYTVSEADYQEAWGSDEDFIKAFAPITPATASLPGILADAFPDASEGDYAVISYQQADTNPVFGTVGGGEEAAKVYLEESFDEGMGDFTIEDIILPEGASYVWSHAAPYGMKASAYVSGANHKSESWLISPEMTLSDNADAVLTFDQAVNFFASLETAAEEATVNVRVKGGDWTRLTIPSYPESMSWSFVASGDIDLSAYNGKTIEIGFCYTSTDEKAGTWEVKNVKVADSAAMSKAPAKAPAAEVPTVGRNAIYYFNGSSWTVPGSMLVLQPSDYTDMGSTYGNLSGTQPEQYLPAYLTQTLPYAQEETAEIVVYRYYDGSTTSWKASQLTLTEGKWVLNIGATVDKFTRKDGVWNYNPSVELVLPYSRNTDPSYTYYMACAEWVFDNITKKFDPSATWANGEKPGPPFIDYRGNAEFYSGASAYYGNVDVRATTAINNAPSGYDAYEGLSDEEITELIKERFVKETLPGALSRLHSDARPVDGMEVTYTITFTAYTTEGANAETVVYTVTGPAEFTYNSCSWWED